MDVCDTVAVEVGALGREYHKSLRNQNGSTMRIHSWKGARTRIKPN